MLVFIPQDSGVQDPWWHEKLAKKLSKDRPMESVNGYYVIYANGTRWLFSCFCTWELYWVPETSYKGPLKEVVEQRGQPEYYCTWRPGQKNLSAIKWIIKCHPNLKAPNWYWSIRKFLEI